MISSLKDLKILTQLPLNLETIKRLKPFTVRNLKASQ